MNELEYLKMLQKYLLFIGMKDILDLEKAETRYQNELQKKYENIRIKKFDNSFIDKILNNEINYQIIDIPNNYSSLNKTGYKVLVIDENFEFKLLIKYKKEEIVNNKLLLYFKVLENYS